MKVRIKVTKSMRSLTALNDACRREYPDFRRYKHKNMKTFQQILIINEAVAQLFTEYHNDSY